MSFLHNSTDVQISEGKALNTELLSMENSYKKDVNNEGRLHNKKVFFNGTKSKIVLTRTIRA